MSLSCGCGGHLCAVFAGGELLRSTIVGKGRGKIRGGGAAF